MRAYGRQQPFLPLEARLPDLGEAGGDHDERADARAQRLLGGRHDSIGRDGDHGQVDRVGDLGHGRVRPHARHRLRAPVDRVGGAAEVTREDVPEELPADRSASPGGPDHGDGARLEERPEGGDDGRMVPLVDVPPVALRRCDRELHLDLAVLELAGELEACGLEDAQHLAVVGHHLGDEPLDADLRGAVGEALEEPGADALALEVVGHREGRLGERGVAQPRVVRDRDDPLAVVLSERADEGAALLPVGVERRLDQRPVQRREPVEARVAARRGEAVEELEDRLPVGRDRRPEPERAPVAEDDVDGRRSGSGHARDRRAGSMAHRPGELADLEQPDLAEVDVREGVRHEGIEARLVDLDVEHGPAAGRDADRLHAPLELRHVAVHPGAVEDRADDVEVRVEGRACGHDVESHGLPGIGNERMGDVLVGVAVERRPVRLRRSRLRHVE